MSVKQVRKLLYQTTLAASYALFRPEETLTPSMAVPLLHMTALTSAKSTFDQARDGDDVADALHTLRWQKGKEGVLT